MPSSVHSCSRSSSSDRSSISGRGMQTSALGNNEQRPLKSCLRNVDHSGVMAPNCRVDDTPDGNCDCLGDGHCCCEGGCKPKKKGTLCVARRAARFDGPGIKKVCFADSKGLNLATVRVADGPSDTPPKLSDKNLFEEVVQDEQAKPNPPYTYVPDFEQPSSEYLDFRNRLERDKVCLENLLLEDNLSVMGTVKVRNIAMEKSVKVRVTFDEWKTFRDVPAAYVYPEGYGPRDEAAAASPPPPPDKYDTFKFQFELPPNQGERPTAFCVCFECNGNTFWDNNRGGNYRIITLRGKEDSEQERMLEHYRSLSCKYPWSKVHFHSVDPEKERPYW